MPQTAENFAFEGKYDEAIPVASTQVSAGDAVMMNTGGAILPVTANMDGHMKFCGISDDDWSATRAIQLYGAASADFAIPTTRPVRLKYYPDGIFNLAIREVAGTKGQSVYIQTGTTGVQVFTIDPLGTEVVGPPIGELYENFTGAAAQDRQRVRIRANKSVHRELRHWMMNHLISWNATQFTNSGMAIAQSAPSTSYCPTWGKVIAIVNGILVSIASDSETGQVDSNNGTYSCVILWAFGSGGSVVAYKDSAKQTLAVARVTMRADSIYWPSVTIDHLPFAVGVFGGCASEISGTIYAVYRTLANCLRVS